jgi:hypothetical protein
VLLREVLEALEGDVVAALQALEQMLPTGSSFEPGGHHSSSSCSEGSCSDSSCSDSSAEGLNRGSTSTAAAAAATAHRAGRQQLTQQRAQYQHHPAGPEDLQVACQQHQAQQQQQQQARQALGSQQHQQQQQQQQQQPQPSAEAAADTYRSLRGEAMKLSHKYRKASRK